MKEKRLINKNSKAFYFLIGALTAVIVLIIAGFIFFGNNINLIAASDLVSKNDFPQDYRIISPEIPKDVYFAGERVPLENFEVYERIDREMIVNTYLHSSTILALKRANRWFPVIEPILKEYNVPDDFKYLAVAESNLENVVSPAGATGFWQFMKGAADKYGLEVNNEIDERYHVEKATEAACKYLLESYQKYGNWTMAAASYNMGVSGVDNQIERQKANNYYNLVLGIETSRFIARIVSLKVIMQNPQKYGFDLMEIDLYLPLKTYEVELSELVTDFADWAAERGINYKILKMYNPWLRESYLKNKSKKTYTIKLPEKGSIQIIN
ncbi:MAG: lytic transglycosylase domain-containing protein [Ignavibacteriaceae bacterium]|nr:lytic transglycosylase domain-containing protein [Ignavibacteriaceae bacterium]